MDRYLSCFCKIRIFPLSPTPPQDTSLPLLILAKPTICSKACIEDAAERNSSYDNSCMQSGIICMTSFTAWQSRRSSFRIWAATSVLNQQCSLQSVSKKQTHKKLSPNNNISTWMGLLCILCVCVQVGVGRPREKKSGEFVGLGRK